MPEHEGERGRHVRDAKGLGCIKEEEFTRRRGVVARRESPGPAGASPQRPPAPPAAAERELRKPREGAQTPRSAPPGEAT